MSSFPRSRDGGATVRASRSHQRQVVSSTVALRVRAITPAEHLAAIDERPSVSFLQTPAWGRVKRDWRAESVGWFSDSELVGVGLILYRQAPMLRRYLAYLPEGPAIDWSAAVAADDLARWLDPLTAYVRSRGAFAIRMGPPVPLRRWSAATVKDALADERVRRLDQVEPDVSSPTGLELAEQLTAAGWRPPTDDGGFTAGQPRYVVQLPLAGRDEDDLLKGFNQLWRRNVKKAEKAGVAVERGQAEHLPEFHRLYVETANRMVSPHARSNTSTACGGNGRGGRHGCVCTWRGIRDSGRRGDHGAGQRTPGTPTARRRRNVVTSEVPTPCSGG